MTQRLVAIVVGVEGRERHACAVLGHWGVGRGARVETAVMVAARVDGLWRPGAVHIAIADVVNVDIAHRGSCGGVEMR